MHADDANEIFATRRQRNADEIAYEASSLDTWIYSRDETPVTAFGVAEAWPGVWQVFMFSTEPPTVKSGAEIIRHYRGVIIPYMLAHGAHRAQCDSSSTHTIAHRFIERFGGRLESVMFGYGKDGEDFIRYAWDTKALELQAAKIRCINTPLTGERNVRVVTGK